MRLDDASTLWLRNLSSLVRTSQTVLHHDPHQAYCVLHPPIPVFFPSLEMGMRRYSPPLCLYPPP